MGREGPLGPPRETAAGAGGASASRPAEAPAGRARASRAGEPAPVAVPIPRLSERDAWTALAAVEGIGPVTFAALVGAGGSARRVLALGRTRRGRARLAAAAAAAGLRLPDAVAEAIGAAPAGWPALRARLEATGVMGITAEDEQYPARLRAIDLPPPVLFVRGAVDALDAPRVTAVVGTRRPTDEGRRVAARLGGTLAAAGAVVVSGLAVGIDGAAHAGALAAGGRSVAVLGSGHARLYPAVHAPLAEEVVRSGGAVVAELPPDAGPTAAGFPRRNRIIAGLADATVVVEAGERSGALITASWALEQGRAVFAVPGPLDRPQSVGCNRLLRAAAGEVRIVAGADELLEDLGYAVELPARRARPGRSVSTPPDPGAVVARLEPAEAAAVRALLGGPRTADGIAAASDLAPATILAVLTRLETDGLVRGVFGRYHLAGPLAGVHAGPGHPGSSDDP